jgi:hypothetical protein
LCTEIRSEARPDDDDESSALNEGDDDIEITEQADGSCVLSLSVPSPFLRFIIGKGGKSRTTIERETQASITIPKQKPGSSALEQKISMALCKPTVMRACMRVNGGTD